MSQTAVFPERTWEAEVCKSNLWSKLLFQFWFWLTVVRMCQCCYERWLLPVVQQLLSLWAMLIHTSIIFQPLVPTYWQWTSAPALQPCVISFPGEGLQKRLDDPLVQGHNNKRRPQPRILWAWKICWVAVYVHMTALQHSDAKHPENILSPYGKDPPHFKFSVLSVCMT